MIIATIFMNVAMPQQVTTSLVSSTLSAILSKTLMSSNSMTYLLLHQILSHVFVLVLYN